MQQSIKVIHKIKIHSRVVVVSSVLFAVFFGASLGTLSATYADELPIQNEVYGSFGSLNFQSQQPTFVTLGTGRMGVGYGRVLTPWLEVSSKISYSYAGSTPGAASETGLQFTVGPTFNFPWNDPGIANAFFISLGIGLNYASIGTYSLAGTYYSVPSSSSTSLAYDITVGKRFKLLTSVSWSPALTISGFVGTNLFTGLVSTPNYGIVPLRISILF